MARADHARAGLTIRCAIYTRKSSDEGLEQEFNSLDAHREACEAYIVSQRHAGWIALADMYDDGGLSGGTMERPALKRLLEDIQAGKVQIVVVYKISWGMDSDQFWGQTEVANPLNLEATNACAAFILSQKHEGWTVLPTLYDDGGFSGGTMERPALKRLIADIEAGQIDVVVVYKVDRLTRALSDFAKLVEVFDRRGVSFVSITQQFNTTTSMGRLTLNVLLSFAQFEREVTGERIRDKIAASKKKGMWMGGMPPLGYDVKNRKLVVNDAEARIVVEIYRRYLALKSVHALRDALADAGIKSKRRMRPGGEYGGQTFSRGALYLILQNRVRRLRTLHRNGPVPETQNGGLRRAKALGVSRARFRPVTCRALCWIGRRKSEEPPLLLPIVRQIPGEHDEPCGCQRGISISMQTTGDSGARRLR